MRQDTINKPVGYNPDPAYIRSLIADTGLSVHQVGMTIGVSERSLRDYCRGVYRVPYPVQYILETLSVAKKVN